MAQEHYFQALSSARHSRHEDCIKIITYQPIIDQMFLRIDGNLNRISFSAAHFIPTIEKCSRLHGHDYSVGLELEGDPVDGILIDYGIVKSTLRLIVDEMDHKVLVPRNPGYSEVVCNSGKCIVKYNLKEYVFPASDVFLLDRSMTSSEMIADYVLGKFVEKLKGYSNLKKARICIYEGPGQCTCQESAING
ncbi:MAG: 6-pyruvoyl tetrahydropterin synthase family protein [Candidatus Thermoplasmatota archaeon]|nr:6-pyruvoyl tetrahydropterin synthase family protein [Candidatus Thermoplasmatota archaeon]MCL6089821.1 6-pyruvoyl tetrahydropterin synthase family protein [Candidatus Thermoplasmatota archaeon]